MKSDSWRSYTAAEIFRRIEEHGGCSITNFLSPSELRTAQEYGREYSRAKNNQYVGINTTGDELLKLFLSNDQEDWLTQTMQELFRLKMGYYFKGDNIYSVFRLLRGESGRAESERFHYDGYLVTALVALEMPVVNPHGDLLIAPNSRPVRHFYLMNVIENIWIKLKGKVLRNSGKQRRFQKLALPPGSIHFFWGHLSLHANEACNPDHLRSTALFHYGRPYSRSFLYRALHSGKMGKRRLSL